MVGIVNSNGSTQVQGEEDIFLSPFKAHDQSSGKVVVLKFDHPFVADKYRHECFEREAALLAKFHGEPNIVQLIEEISTFHCSVALTTGQILPIPFRFVSLEAARFSLFEYMHQPKKKYGPLRNLIYFREVCKGVQRLHSARVCHRDLKPQNCLVMTGRYVALGDLGTAKTLYHDGTIPSPTGNYHEPVGDKRYTAPELLCCLDSNNDIALAADIYSLGAILFELFARADLSAYLYSIQEINDKMIRPFSQISEDKRKQVFDASIGALETACPLPNVEDVAPDGTIPESIRVRLNRLYKGLASLDYRRRIKGFESIFLQLELMTHVLVSELRRTRRAQFKTRLKTSARTA